MLHSILYWRLLPDLILFGLAGLFQAGAAYVLFRHASPALRRRVLAGLLASGALLAWGFSLLSLRVAAYYPPPVVTWGRVAVLGWAMISVLIAVAALLSRALTRRTNHRPERRAFLRLAQTVLFGAPAAALGYGVFVERVQLRLREAGLTLPGLPEDLHGLRIVQLTDIHLGPFLGERELERAVDLANETRAHLAVVTGDLITTAHDPLDRCIQILARVRAEAGVFGCMGNHEIYAGSEDYTARAAARRGIRFLRQEAAKLRFGRSSTLNLAGIDYQRFGTRYLTGAEKLVDPDSFNILLSHNPDVFPVAARQGFGLTLAGHTHGGQVRFEILRADLNVARFFTPYVDGVYRLGRQALFVSRGIGTIGMPARVGAPPEVALIRLWRT